jgi:hypothetical protein
MEENKNIPLKQPAENIPEEEQSKNSNDQIISSEENVLLEIEQSEIPPSSGVETIETTNTEKENDMEVHHHSHAPHGKKNWKSYFWEFLMLFLAVFCGFLAEYQLEHKIERDREKEYIVSMIEDAKTDTVNIHTAIAYNTTRIYRLDSLSKKCFNYTPPSNDDAEIYRLFFPSLRHPDFVSPTERTMTQLKNAGGMRLLQKKIAADSILQYDDFAKKIINQQAWYEIMLRELVDAGMPLFNFKYQTAIDLATLKPMVPSYDAAKLVFTGKASLIELGNRALMYRNVVIFYIRLLQEGEQHAVNLIQTLEKEYPL